MSVLRCRVSESADAQNISCLLDQIPAGLESGMASGIALAESEHMEIFKFITRPIWPDGDKVKKLTIDEDLRSLKFRRAKLH